MQTIDFYYDGGKRHTIIFDGVRTSLIEQIIRDSREEDKSRIGDCPRIVVVSDTPLGRINLYTCDGAYITALTPEFAAIIDKLMGMYYPYTREETVQEAKEAAGI